MDAAKPSPRDRPPPADAPGARLFVVRLWREELAGGSEHRGSVRDVTTDAFLGFRDWSSLVAFMVARVERAGGHPAAREDLRCR